MVPDGSVVIAVLAPKKFYKRCDLTKLDRALNAGLANFKERGDLELSFEFNQLGTAYSDGSVECAAEAVNTRSRIWAAT